jgi:hypothetical protein
MYQKFSDIELTCNKSCEIDLTQEREGSLTALENVKH